MENSNGILNLLAGLACGECALFCFVLLAGMELLPNVRWRRRVGTRRMPLPAGRWLAVGVSRMVAVAALVVFVFAYIFNRGLAFGAHPYLGGISAMALGIFCALELFAAYRVKRMRTFDWHRGAFAASLSLHFVLMNALAYAAMYEVSLFSGQREYPWGNNLGWDSLYVTNAAILAVAVPAVLVWFLREIWPQREFLLGCAGQAAVLFAAYVLMIPVQARYLVFATPQVSGYSIPVQRWAFAHLAREAALSRLVPWLPDFAPLDTLPPDMWTGITMPYEPFPDETFMAQLRRAARSDVDAAMEKLYFVEPDTARQYAAELLDERNSPEVRMRSIFGARLEWLFLECPDLPVFKRIVPCDEVRTRLHALLSRWTVGVAEEVRGESFFNHNRWFNAEHIALMRIVSDLVYEGDRLVWRREAVHDDLRDACIELIAWCNESHAYGLLGSSRRTVATKALGAIVEKLRRQEKLVVADRKSEGLDLNDVLGTLHPDVAFECMRTVVRVFGERAVLGEWLPYGYGYDEVREKISQLLLSRWNEVVPDASPMSGSGPQACFNYIKWRESVIAP